MRERERETSLIDFYCRNINTESESVVKKTPNQNNQ